jgi:hypothetical protein
VDGGAGYQHDLGVPHSGQCLHSVDQLRVALERHAHQVLAEAERVHGLGGRGSSQMMRARGRLRDSLGPFAQDIVRYVASQPHNPSATR